MKLWQRRLEMLKATTAPRLHPSFRCWRLRLRDNQPNYTRICKLRHRSDATRSMTLLTLFHPGIPPPIGRGNPQLDHLQSYERSSCSLSRTQLRGAENNPVEGEKEWTSGRRRLTLQSHKHNPHTRPWSTNGTVKSHTKLWAALCVRSYLGVCSVSPRGQLIGALPQVMHSVVPPIACPAGHHGREKTRKCSEAQQPVTWRVPNNNTFTEDYNSLCLSC